METVEVVRFRIYLEADRSSDGLNDVKWEDNHDWDFLLEQLVRGDCHLLRYKTVWKEPLSGSFSVNFWIWYKVRDQSYCFVDIQFSQHHLRERLSFLNWMVLEVLSTPFDHIYFLALYSVPLEYMSLFMPVPHCFDYCLFLVSFEIRKCENSNLVLLFQNRCLYVHNIV